MGREGFSDVGQEPAVDDHGPEADGKLGPRKEAEKEYLIHENQA
jgi:hypothetical protein